MNHLKSSSYRTFGLFEEQFRLINHVLSFKIWTFFVFSYFPLMLQLCLRPPARCDHTDSSVTRLRQQELKVKTWVTWLYKNQITIQPSSNYSRLREEIVSLKHPRLRPDEIWAVERNVENRGRRQGGGHPRSAWEGGARARRLQQIHRQRRPVSPGQARCGDKERSNTARIWGTDDCT